MEQSNRYIARTSGLKFKDYLGYGMIDAAGCLIFSLVTTLLQKYYTDILHLSPLFIMLMFIGARIWDAINDPIMGRIADTAQPTRAGRYRPWVLYAALPLAVCGVLMFVKLPNMGEPEHMLFSCIYATVTYVLFGMAYTMLQIPYGSLASVVTTDDKERSKLSVFRSIGAALGSIPVLLIASFAYAKRVDASGSVVLGENGKAITDMQYRPVITGVIIMAVVSAALLILAYTMNRERVKTKPQPKEKGATKKAIGLLFKNRAFVAISLVSMLLLSGQMFTQSFYTYLFDDYFHANWMNLATQACTYSPMPMTGMPSVAASSALRWFATPLPGAMPVSAIWMVVPSRSSEEQASASTAMTATGAICRTIAKISSADSMPVCPRTPPESALTCRSERRNASSSESSCRRCRVASTPAAVRGPSASGVMSGFPSPATRTQPSAGSSARSSSASSSARASFSSEKRESASLSSVI